jgi:hypothetical protein
MLKFLLLHLLLCLHVIYANNNYLSLKKYEQQSTNDSLKKEWTPISVSDIEFLDKKTAIRMLNITTNISLSENKALDENSYFRELLDHLSFSETLVTEYIFDKIGCKEYDRNILHIVKIIYYKNKAILLLEDELRKNNFMYFVTKNEKNLHFSPRARYGRGWLCISENWSSNNCFDTRNMQKTHFHKDVNNTRSKSNVQNIPYKF